MSLSAASAPQTPPARFAGFLAVALLAHGLLLLLPAHRALQPDAVLHRLSVSLSAMRPADSVPVRPTPDPETPATVPPAAPQEASAVPAVPPEVPAATPPPGPRLSAARLLDDAHRMRWALPDEGVRRPMGDVAPEAGRDRAPAQAPATAAIEVVDRWLAADGSHNVLIRTPTGDMLCGRAAAWDPTQPLVEPVLIWRACGNGRSTFEWPEHYRAGASSRSREQPGDP